MVELVVSLVYGWSGKEREGEKKIAETGGRWIGFG